MNKYFLPVYHSELKPWIKWWILKRLGGGESTLKAVTLSEGTITKVDKSKALSIKEYYGNTVQDGTPTPDSPVEVQTISGDNSFSINNSSYRVDFGGKNKFNYSSASDIDNTIISTYRLYKIENLEPNTEYNINNIDINAPLEAQYIYLWSNTYYSGSQKYFIAAFSGYQTKVNFTSNAEGEIYLAIYPTDTNTWNSLITKLQYAQIEKGTVATPYSPYVSNPIELCKIGDYKDKIVNDNGTWKIEKKVGKAVADSSYFSGRGTTGTNAYFLETNITTCLNDNTKELSMSDMFRPCSFTNRANGLDITYVQNGILVLRTANNTNIDWSSATTAKTWLDNNKPILYYALATPSTETITNTNLISELNTLYEFYVNSSKVTISNNSEIPLEVLLEYYGR